MIEFKEEYKKTGSYKKFFRDVRNNKPLVMLNRPLFDDMIDIGFEFGLKKGRIYVAKYCEDVISTDGGKNWRIYESFKVIGTKRNVITEVFSSKQIKFPYFYAN